ncbi:MAG: hypothetical protein M3O35_00595, partial [Acidobacteriota bacterium]|nr:hypothetical protein [Acidobacteriota bacterium]
ALGIPGVGSLPGFPAGLPILGPLGPALGSFGIKIPGFNTNGGGFETGASSINLPFYGSGSTVGGGSASANSVLLDFPFASTNKAGAFSFSNGSSSLAAGLFNGSGAGNAALSGVASATALYSGVTSAIHGFRQGGAQGTLSGIGALAGTAALFDPEPFSKAILGGVAAFTGIISSIFGDPKAERQSSINHELTNNRYYAPLPKRMTIDESGNLVDFSSTNAVRSYQGSWETRQDAANPITGVPVIVNVHALDAKNIIDHGPAIAEAVRVAVNRGAARPMVRDLQQQMMPR